MLAAKNLEVGYGNANVGLNRVAGPMSMVLPAGNLVCLLGPNGAGKSSLLRTLAGLQPALAGKVTLDDADVHRLSARERARKLSVVLTDSEPASLLDVQTVVGLGRYAHTGWSGKLSAEDLRLVHWAIEVVGINDLAGRAFSELSDGERQKTMIARALAQEARILILDEITAYLDLPRRVQTMRLLRRIARESGRAVLLSSHDLDLALRSADCMWLMSKDEPMAIGAPEDLVLTGDFERVFSQDGVQFDRTQGSFRINNDSGIPLHLVGEGIEANWTARALEREGFQLHETSAKPGNQSLQVEVVQGRSGYEWLLTSGDRQSRYGNLFDLSQELRTLLPAISSERLDRDD